jgi:hypothetical protein
LISLLLVVGLHEALLPLGLLLIVLLDVLGEAGLNTTDDRREERRVVINDASFVSPVLPPPRARSKQGERMETYRRKEGVLRLTFLAASAEA